MKDYIGAIVLVLIFSAAASARVPQQGSDVAPPFAYPVNPPAPAGAPPAAPPDASMKHVPNSTQSFTVAQTRDLFNVPDWHADQHPALPEVVSNGRKPDVRACGYCHLPDGQGRPENASLAGLSVPYFIQQMADFKSGARKSAEPKMGPPAAMIAVAKAATDAEVRAAADYFSSLKPKPWIRVVESATALKTHPAGGMLVPDAAGGTEPLGERIVETPENLERTELRDDASGFVAYVPMGSIAKGEALVRTGGEGKTIACGICHGPDLKGLGPIPALAGRSPSYLIRQLYDMQHGARNGVWTDLMKGAVAHLNQEDMVNIAAFLASREVGAAPATSTSSAPAAGGAGGDAQLGKGKDLYHSYGCFECHGENGEGTASAPDLTGTHLSADQISKFIQNPSPDARGAGMPNIEASSADLQPVVAYVVSLKKAQ